METALFYAQAKIWACEAKNGVLKPIFEDVKQKLRQICKNSEKVLAIFPNMDIIRIVVSTQSK